MDENVFIFFGILRTKRRQLSACLPRFLDSVRSFPAMSLPTYFCIGNYRDERLERHEQEDPCFLFLLPYSPCSFPFPGGSSSFREARNFPLPPRLTRLFRISGLCLCTPQPGPLSVYRVTASFSGGPSVAYATSIRIRGHCHGSGCITNGRRHFLVRVLPGRQPCPCRNPSR